MFWKIISALAPFLILVLLFFISGCDYKSGPKNQQKLIEGQYVDYIKDNSTGICFAKYVYQQDKQFAISIIEINCKSIENLF